MKRLTVEQAARIARTTPDDVRTALASGDLRALNDRAVERWVAGRIASKTVGGGK